MTTKNTLVVSFPKSINSKLIILLAFFIPLSTTISSILWVLFMLIWILEGNFSEKSAYIWQHKACYASLTVLFSLLLASSYSLATWPEILLYLKKMSKLIYLPFLLAYFKDPKQRLLTINAIILAGLVTVALGVIGNSYAPIKNSIDTSLITIISTFLLMHKLHNTKNIYINLATALCIIINVFYLYNISSGKTSQLIFLLLVPVYFMQIINLMSKTKILLLLFFPLLLTLGILGKYSSGLHNTYSYVINKYQEYTHNPDNYQHNTVSQRIIYYKNSFKLIQQKPFTGWGTGSFFTAYKKNIKYNSFNSQHKEDYLYPNNPHNEYLSFGVQIGIYGLAILIWLFHTLFKASFSLPINEKFILQGIVIIISIGCLTNSWLMDFMSGNLFIMLTAVSLGGLPDVRLINNSKSA